MLSTYERNSRLKLTTTIVAVLVVAGIVVFADHLKAESSKVTATTATSTTSGVPTSTPTTNSASSSGSSGTSTSAGSYKDGSYTASSDYRVPHGDESIQVSLTLKDGVVTAASVQNSENNFDSAQFQEEFAASYKSYVIGKKISSLQLGVVAGASDTTAGFNEALSQITNQAQA